MKLRVALFCLAALASMPDIPAFPQDKDQDSVVPQDQVVKRLTESSECLAKLMNYANTDARILDGYTPPGAYSPNKFLGKVKRRLEAVLQDFVAINDRPLRTSRFNIETLQMPVKRYDYDDLQRRINTLKAYETDVRRFAEEEKSLARQQLTLWYQIEALRGKVPSNDEERTQIVSRAYSLLDQVNLLDAADHQLIRRFNRKVYFVEIPSHYSGGNRITPLIDGVATYKRINELISRVADNAAGKGYINISLWECDANTDLLGNGTSFHQSLLRAAANGNKVSILLWKPSATAVKVASKSWINSVAEKNQQAKIQFESPNIRVQLAEHADYSGSYHQKTFIFNDGAELSAIVGGLNLDPEYRDEPPHVPRPGFSRAWHDVAIDIVGPATKEVENDFVTRWYHIGAQAPPLDAGTPTVPHKEDQWVDIATTGPGSFHVPIGETLDEDTSLVEVPGNQIERELQKRVFAAERYVYLENYAIHHPPLITALGERLASKKSRGERFNVILLVPKPWTDGPFYSWLLYVTYLHLSFMSCDSFEYHVESGPPRKVMRKSDGRTHWSFKYAGSWYEDSEIQWDNGGHTAIRNILAFDGDNPLYYLALFNGSRFQPVYIHSKVCIVDDEYACIGSANFNTRSLTQDGELTAFFHGDSVEKFRQQLWSEYFSGTVPVPDEWDNAALRTGLVELQSGQLTQNKLYVIRLNMSDFEQTDGRKIVFPHPPKSELPFDSAQYR